MTAPAPTSESRAPGKLQVALRLQWGPAHLPPQTTRTLAEPCCEPGTASGCGCGSRTGRPSLCPRGARTRAADASARPGPRLLGAQQGRGWGRGTLRQKQTEASAVARDRKPGSRRSVVAGRPALQGPSGPAREPHFTPESKGSLLGLSVRETAQFSLPRRSGEALLEPEPGRWPWGL